MTRLQVALIAAGVLHFAILTASALVPIVLDWRKHLAPLPPFLRELVWVYGAFVVLTIIGFGAVTLGCSGQLAAGSPLARAVCGFIAVFWTARLGVQLLLFDVRPVIAGRRALLAGYHTLTFVFLYFSLTYGLAAVAPQVLR
jgi:hypothetical protein